VPEQRADVVDLVRRVAADHVRQHLHLALLHLGGGRDAPDEAGFDEGGETRGERETMRHVLTSDLS